MDKSQRLLCEAIVETGMYRGRVCGRLARGRRHGRALCGYHDPAAQGARVEVMIANASAPKGERMEPEISAKWMNATVLVNPYITPRLCARFAITVDGIDLEVIVATTSRTGKAGPTPDSERMLTIAETIGSRLEKAPRL